MHFPSYFFSIERNVSAMLIELYFETFRNQIHFPFLLLMI